MLLWMVMLKLFVGERFWLVFNVIVLVLCRFW